MSFITPTSTCCLDCIYFQKIKSEKENTSSENFFCLAYPEGIPKDFVFEEKKAENFG